MPRLLVVAAFLCALAGCSGWQANSASEAMDVNPLGALWGEPVFTPANGPGYVNGDSLDMRSRH